MKINKYFENVHENLVDKLEKIIINDNKNINGFQFYLDTMIGTFEWSNKDYTFLATPYWDNNKKLPINIMDNTGEDIDFYEIDLITLENDDDIMDVIELYYNEINKITSSLNKRTILKNNLEMILKSIDFIEINNTIDGKFIKDITFFDDIEINKISDNDINKLLNIINDKYSYIITSNKYNL